MRYKIGIGILFIFMILSNIRAVEANSAAPVYVINVVIEGCMYDNNEGFHNIDILINKTSYESRNILDTVNENYIYFNPNYEDYEYMNDTDSDWISYAAYYKNADVQNDTCFISLIDVLSFDIPVLEIKIVYFNDLGETIHLSDVIEIDPEIAGIRIEGSIYFNPDTFEITNNIQIDEGYKPPLAIYFVGAIILSVWGSILMLPVLILFSSTLEALIAVAFRFKFKMVLTILVLNIFTQILMFIFFGIFDYPYYINLVILEIAIYLFEFLTLILIFKEIDKFKIFAFVIVANTFTLILGSIIGIY